MTVKSMCGIGLAIFVASFASALDAEATGGEHLTAEALPSKNVQVENQVKAVREILDPHTGDRWMLVRDPVHPGGPGRLVLATDLTAIRRNAVAARMPALGSSSPFEQPAIRAGDRVIVEEHTAIVDAQLEGTALSPATGGASLAVRLTIGGRVVQVQAVGPGRAALLLRSEAGR